MRKSNGAPSDQATSERSAREARPASAPDPFVPGLPLDQIGQALASFYDDLLSEGLPDNLARLVQQVDRSKTGGSEERGKLAIVVEDDPEVRALAVALFEETRLSVIACESAEDALDVLRDHGGDVALVFADIGLAGDMDGIQLAQAVATLWPKTRLVITSGLASRRLDEMPEEAVFISKPWRSVDLLVLAERAAGKPPPAVA